MAGKKVLVVDDEKLIVKGIRFSLEQDNMEVDCAYDGEEAVSYTHLDVYKRQHERLYSSRYDPRKGKETRYDIWDK